MADDTHDEPGGFATEAAIWAVVLLLFAGWGLSIFKWGVLGLYMPAVIAVPIVMIVMVWLSRG